MSSGVSSHNTQQVRALQVYMVDLIATEYEAKCSALIVVVNAQADALEKAPLDEDNAISGE